MIRPVFIGMLAQNFYDFIVMRISLIGSGRVATQLAQVLTQQHHIVQIFSRQLVHAQQLAGPLCAEPIHRYEQINPHVDLIIIAVSDTAIAEMIAKLHAFAPSVLIVHTSGSTPLERLTQQHDNAGVFYPLQTFSFERPVEWRTTPIFVEAQRPASLDILTQLANSLSNQVYQYSSEQRLSLHLAAVFACNFSNYCYDLAKQIVDPQQVDFSLLYPLIQETAQKAMLYDPHRVQTGPAVRGDQAVLELHRQLLIQAGRPELEQVYQLLSQGIFSSHHAAQ